MKSQETSYGDIDLWSKSFPTTLIPEILNLIIDVWPKCLSEYSFTPSDHEPRITRRLKYLLQQERTLRKIPVRIQREVPEEIAGDDVEEKGRIDLVFTHGPLENVYFAFECKRLNISSGGSRKSLASEYVGIDGLGTFIREWYAVGLSQAGMLGYVMDSDINYAQARINKRILSRKNELNTNNGLEQSNIIPEATGVKLTIHKLSDRTMSIHHIFLPLNSN